MAGGESRQSVLVVEGDGRVGELLGAAAGDVPGAAVVRREEFPPGAAPGSPAAPEAGATAGGATDPRGSDADGAAGPDAAVVAPRGAATTDAVERLRSAGVSPVVAVLDGRDDSPGRAPDPATALEAGATFTVPEGALAETPGTVLRRVAGLAGAGGDGTEGEGDGAGATPIGPAADDGGGRGADGGDRDDPGARGDRDGPTPAGGDRAAPFENDPAPVAEVVVEDGTPRVVAVNDAFESAFGADGVEGATVADALVPASDPGTRERLLDRLRRGEAATAEVTRRTADGPRAFRLRVVPFERSGPGRRARAYVRYSDVTERREYERRFERERDRRSALFENNPDPVVRVRFEGTEPVIRAVNPAFERVFGFEPGDVVGSTVTEALVPEGEREEHDRLRRRAARGDPVEAEAPRCTADGRREFMFRVIHFDAESGDGSGADTAAPGGDPGDGTGAPVGGVSDPGDAAPGDPAPGDGDQTDAYVWYTDVTERRRRERLVGALHEATDEIQEADSREAVCAAAVEAADEVLGLSAPTCWLAADDGEGLSPVATAGDGDGSGFPPGADGPPPTLEPGECGHEAYERDEPTVLDPGELPGAGTDGADAVGTDGTGAAGSDDPGTAGTDGADAVGTDGTGEMDGAGAPAGPAMLVPLGEHGLFGAADPTGGGLDGATGDAARILARHVRTALDRVERERKRRESERRFRAIAGCIDEVIYLAAPDLSELYYVNDAYEEVWEQPVEELFADPTAFLDAVDPRDREQFEAELASMVADVESGDPEDSYEFEYRIRPNAGDAEDGEVKWVHVTGYPVEIDGERRFVGVVEDVTERERRRREYEQIFDGVNDAITIHDPETGEMLAVNETFCEMVGYDRGTLLEMEISEFSRTDLGYTTERGHEFIRRVGRTGEPDQVEWALETADGETRWVEVHGTVAEIDGERRFLAIDRDVTEAKRREREYEQIFDGVNDSIVVHDPETGEMVEANETFCELVGYDRDRVLELGTAGLGVTEEGYTPERAEEIIAEVMDEGEVGPFEWKVETSDGEHRLLEVTGTRAEIGGELRHVSLMRDITERRRREREYEQIFDGVNDAIAVFDPETGEITTVNETYHELLGYEDIERIRELGIEGLSVTEEGYTGERGRKLLREVAETGEPTTVEWRVETSDGRRPWLEVTLAPATIGGQKRVLSMQRDVTERKRRQREFEQIFDGVTDAISVHDPETGEMLDVNETYVEQFGFEDKESVLEAGVEGLSVTEAGYTAERSREIIREVAETGDQVTVEWLVETADGDRRWFEVNTTRAEIGGETRVLGISRDVTEAKRRQREFEQIFDGVNDAIAVFDPEAGEITTVNETYHELLGYEDVERIRELGIEGLSVTEEGYTGERGWELIREVAETGEPTTVEWRAETKAGERLWLEATLAPATIGGEQRVLSMQRDVTERRRRGRQLEVIVERIDEAIYLAERGEARPAYLSPAYEDLTGLDLETLYEDRTAFVEHVHPEDRPRYREFLDGIRRDVYAGETEDRYDIEFRFERPDGEVRWFHGTGYPLKDAGQYGYIGVLADVTERKRRQREFEQIFDGVNDGITVHDPETAELLAVNDSLCEMVGRDRETVLEMGLSGISATDLGYTMAEAREFVRGVVESGESRETDWAVETADGEVRWLRARGTVAEIGGETRYVGLVRDVTERRRSERHLRTVAERVDAVIYVASPDLREVHYLSPGYEEVWDQPVERMYEDPEAFLDRVHPEDEGWLREEMASIRRDMTDPDREPQDSYEFEYRIVDGDGETRWVEVRGYPVRDAAGNLDRFVSLNLDVTERKRRRRTLESFHDATAELSTAETPAAACRTAVAAAADVFGLEAAVHLFEEEAGRLEPVAATDGLGPVDGLPAWTGEDRTPWETFVDESVATVDPGSDPALAPPAGADAEGDAGGAGGDRPDADGAGSGSDTDDREGEGERPPAVADPASAVVLPLSGHGTLTVWLAEEDVDDVEAANVLAATLEAALNHIAGQRRLESQREKLEAHAERARQLETLTELSRRVESAIAEESSRAGIERAICDRLAAVDGFEGVWTGGPGAGSDPAADGGGGAGDGGGDPAPTPEVRTTEGVPEAVPERALAAAAPGDPHPAVEAWRRGEPVVATEMVGGARGGWRRALLRRGVGAVCAVPLTYEGITHGVVVVHAEGPAAVDGEVVETLDQLGTSVGYALTAIERRRALESDDTVELEFRTDGPTLPIARLAAATDCQVRHDRTVRRRDGSLSVVYSVVGDLPDGDGDGDGSGAAGDTDDEAGDDAGGVAAAAAAELPGETTVVSRRDGEAVVEREGTTWFGSVVSEFGGVLRRAHATPEGTTLVVELPARTDRRRFVDRLRETIPGVELFAQRQREAEATPTEVTDRLERRLSERQFEALETAHDMGYFDWPREHSGEAVAEAMGITQPTLNKHLRVAERKVFDLLLDAEGGAGDDRTRPRAD